MTSSALESTRPHGSEGLDRIGPSPLGLGWLRRAGPVLGALALWAVAVAWFRYIHFESMMGDDVLLLDSYTRTPRFLDATFPTGPHADKFRPVYFALEWVRIRLFGGHYPLYLWFNLAFHAVLGTFVYWVASRLSRRDWLVAFAAGLLFVTARFSYYDVAQLLGFMEALALAWVLLVVWLAVRWRETDDPRWLAGILAAYVLLVFTHERFMAIAPFTAMVPLLSRRLTTRAKLAWAAALGAPAPLFVVLKTLVVRSALLVGTGSTTLTFDWKRIAGFWVAGVLNLFGVNLGPDHLSIRDFPEMPLENRAACIVFAVAAVATIALSIRAVRRESPRTLAPWAVLVGTLVLGGSITIRQEFRWLFSAYMVMLLVWAWALGSLRSRRLRYGLLAVLVASASFNDRYFRDQSGSLFFMYGENVADSFYREAVQRYGYENREYYLEAFPASNWYVPTTFLRQFLGERMILVNRLVPDDVPRWSDADLERVKVFGLAPGGGAVVDITDVYRERSFARDKRPVANLVDELPRAAVSGRDVGPQYPSGSSVGAVDLAGGRAIFSHANSSMTFEEKLPRGRSYLTFVSKYHPMARGWGVSDGVRAKVELTPAGRPAVEAWSAAVSPTDDGRFVVVPLDACAPDALCRVTLVSGNDPGRNGGGDWLVWVEPRIVVDDSGAPRSAGGSARP